MSQEKMSQEKMQDCSVEKNTKLSDEYYNALDYELLINYNVYKVMTISYVFYKEFGKQLNDFLIDSFPKLAISFHFEELFLDSGILIVFTTEKKKIVKKIVSLVIIFIRNLQK